MCKKILLSMMTLFLCATVLIAPQSAHADKYSYITGDWLNIDGIEGGQIVFDSTTGTITFCQTSVTSAEIPATINGVPVVAIGERAFYHCTNLVTLVLPDTVTTLGEYAFHGCNRLTSLVLPDSVTEIGHSSFGYGLSLTSVVLSNSMTAIPNGAFLNCPNLLSVTIPQSITYIGLLAVSASELTNIYYTGTMEQWEAITYHEWGPGYLFAATVHTQDAVDYPILGTPSDWAQEEISSAMWNSLAPHLTGTPTYRADITRLQFAELIVNMVELAAGEITPADEDTFTDATDDSVLKAYAAGIINGMTQTTFAPDATTNREQIATMISRAIDYISAQTGTELATEQGDLSTFTDENLVSSWAMDAVARLATNGIMNGTSTTTLSPQDTTSVEMSILLLYRLYLLI